MKPALFALCLAAQLFVGSHAWAYSENGHRAIGAVADQVLAGTPTAAMIQKLIGPITLERASTLPDELRGEDRAPGTFRLPENPQLQADLLAFRSINNPTEDLTRIPPSHHWFHYTDVPIECTSYAAAKVGTSKWDVVHMIAYCTRVLEGKEKPDNDLKITPGVAVVLLAHMVGDIHQPMHVGAIFLDKQGKQVDGNSSGSKDPKTTSEFESRGGNSINFGATNLHAYWDFDAVEACLSYKRRLAGKLADAYTAHDLALEFAKSEPAAWKVDATIPAEKWAEKWADEIMPIAREAHTRLKFLPREEFSRDRKGEPVLRWTAIEIPYGKKDRYEVWASKTVEKEMPLAGWRLAGLLGAALDKKTP